ncbi:MULTISPECIES: hypothetical protein [unclassified Neptuniibacter]|uniref:hypothetical protein n=1 Tax=unclassified Neptuniibacter TaxID=2630693 RepID=UPI0025E4F67B|nr:MULTISPECIES: hypothetical protein [unclassified Neptuniibacter]
MVKKSQIQCIDVTHFSIDKKNDSCSDEVLSGNENLQEKTVNKNANKRSQKSHSSK